MKAAVCVFTIELGSACRAFRMRSPGPQSKALRERKRREREGMRVPAEVKGWGPVPGEGLLVTHQPGKENSEWRAQKPALVASPDQRWQLSL